jgi:hypothetical protein
MKVAHLLALLILSVAGIATAKCAYHEYDFHGLVVDGSTHQPVANATVLIFLDDYDSTVSGGYLTKYPDFFLSDSTGRFTAVSYFDSYRTNSILGGDICDKEPTRIELIIMAPRFLSKRIELRFKSLKHQKISRWKNGVELPAIMLKPSRGAQ